MTKKVVAIMCTLVLAAFAGLIAGCGSNLPSGSVAQVGQTYITQEQLDARATDLAAYYGSSVPDQETDPEGYAEFKREVLNYMVTYAVVEQKAQELGISVTAEDIQKEIDSIVTDSFGGDQTKFDEALKAQNMTVDQLKQNYKESMLLQAAYEKVTADVTSVPDDDIAAYYEGHKSDYHVDETRTARHILISPTKDDEASSDTTSTSGSSTTTTAAPTEADWAAALETAKKVRADLVAGADWAKEVTEYSDDAGTKDSGGDLGSISKGEMVQEFEDSVFSLKVNEISQPIKTTYGYHVIQVTAINEAKQYTLDEVKDDISSTLVNQKKSEVWDEWLAKTKTELKVVYKEGMEPTTTTTTTASDSTDTTSGESTTSESTTNTTAATTTSTTEAGSTITTAAPTTTTAAP